MSRKHQVSGKKLNRNTLQRKALFKGLLNSFILKEQIKTTAPKAKAIQGIFDHLVSQGKLGTLHVRRLLHAFLGNQSAVNKLVDEIGPRTGQRKSGFTRITQLGLRKGDNAPIVKIELVDQPAAPAATPTPIKKQSKKPSPKKDIK